MRFFFYFIVAALCTFGFQSFSDSTPKQIHRADTITIAADSGSIDSLNFDVPIVVNLDNSPESITAAELVRYLIDIIGGILAACLIAWLSKKFPKIFGNNSDGINRYKN